MDSTLLLIGHVLAYFLVAAFAFVTLVFIVKRFLKTKRKFLAPAYWFLNRYHSRAAHVLVAGGIVHGALAAATAMDLKPGHVTLGAVVLAACAALLITSQRQQRCSAAGLSRPARRQRGYASAQSSKKADRAAWLRQHHIFSIVAVIALIVHILTVRT